MVNKFSSLLEAVQACDCVQQQSLFLPESIYYTFYIDSTFVGVIKQSIIAELQNYSYENRNLFHIDHTTKKISIEEWCSTRTQRQACFDEMLQEFRDNNTWACLKKWRNEQYPIYGNKNESDGMFLTIERASAEAFGIRTFGVHITGYVKTADIDVAKINSCIKIWIAKRSYDKGTFPGMLDQIVAGGISAGESPFNSVVRECEEEAGIPKEISETATPAGSIQYLTQSAYGIQPETQYVYDLELPHSFTPRPTDGEVDSFQLLDIDQVLEKIYEGEFKTNSLCVVVDFLIRRGFITPENETDYLKIIDSLHRSLLFPGPGR